MKLAEEIIEVIRAGCFMPFNGNQLLELLVALLKDPAIGTFSDMALNLPRNGLGQPAVGEIVQQLFCLSAIHFVIYK